MAIVGLITLSLLLPPTFPGLLGIKIGNWMMRQGEKYFGLKTIIEDEENLIEHAEEKNKAIIFAVSPHDILPYGAFGEIFSIAYILNSIMLFISYGNTSHLSTVFCSTFQLSTQHLIDFLGRLMMMGSV